MARRQEQLAARIVTLRKEEKKLIKRAEQLFCKAEHILEQYTQGYTPEQYAYCLVVLKDEYDEDGIIPEDAQEWYCRQCIQSAVSAYQDKHPEKLVRSQCFDVSNEILEEIEQCETCCHLFGNILTLQEVELEHWEQLDRLDFQWPQTAYELLQVLRYGDGFDGRLNALAARVIREAEENE